MQRKLTKSIAVLSVSLMVICLVPATLAAVMDNNQKYNLSGMTDGKIHHERSANFDLENSSFEVQQERMLELINGIISKTDSGDINDENITEEMLTTALTNLEEAKKIVENAEKEEELHEARELIHSAMEILHVKPETGRE
jgi:hypothetical protein